jgi:hypothetical protein
MARSTSKNQTTEQETTAFEQERLPAQDIKNIYTQL